MALITYNINSDGSADFTTINDAYSAAIADPNNDYIFNILSNLEEFVVIGNAIAELVIPLSSLTINGNDFVLSNPQTGGSNGILQLRHVTHDVTLNSVNIESKGIVNHGYVFFVNAITEQPFYNLVINTCSFVRTIEQIVGALVYIYGTTVPIIDIYKSKFINYNGDVNLRLSYSTSSRGAHIYNCIFKSLNISGNNASVLHQIPPANDPLIFENCTFDNNRIGIQSNTADTITNCVFTRSGISDTVIANNFNPLNLTYCAFSKSQATQEYGVGCIYDVTYNQCYANRHYQLKETSRLIDVGTDNVSVIDDISGNTRPQGVGYDIGAWEGFILPDDIEYEVNSSKTPSEFIYNTLTDAYQAAMLDEYNNYTFNITSDLEEYVLLGSTENSDVIQLASLTINGNDYTIKNPTTSPALYAPVLFYIKDIIVNVKINDLNVLQVKHDTFDVFNVFYTFTNHLMPNYAVGDVQYELNNCTFYRESDCVMVAPLFSSILLFFGDSHPIFTIDKCIISDNTHTTPLLQYGNSAIDQTQRSSIKNTIFRGQSDPTVSAQMAAYKTEKSELFIGSDFINCNFYDCDVAIYSKTNDTFTNCSFVNTRFGLFYSLPSSNFDQLDITYSASPFSESFTQLGIGCIYEISTSDAYEDDTLYPKNTSPLINGGLTIETNSYDIVGTTRPQGIAFDIGAWEYIPISPWFEFPDGPPVPQKKPYWFRLKVLDDNPLNSSNITIFKPINYKPLIEQLAETELMVKLYITETGTAIVRATDIHGNVSEI